MQYNWWFLPWQVCVLLSLYLRLHPAAPVLSSHQLSVPATASDQTLSAGFMIRILVLKLGRNPCPLSCDSYNLWLEIIHLWSIILTLDPYTSTLNICYNFFSIKVWFLWHDWYQKSITYDILFHIHGGVINCSCEKKTNVFSLPCIICDNNQPHLWTNFILKTYRLYIKFYN